MNVPRAPLWRQGVVCNTPTYPDLPWPGVSTATWIPQRAPHDSVVRRLDISAVLSLYAPFARVVNRDIDVNNCNSIVVHISPYHLLAGPSLPPTTRTHDKLKEGHA
eukprot:scaffold239544_cov28-Tisochrysis_lutea.AAC.2